MQRAKILVRGAVQGVGFRPFIYRLAQELGLTGWVQNSTEGVSIHVEGADHTLEDFLVRVESEKPPSSVIQSFEYSIVDPVGHTRFEIRQSDPSGEKSTLVLPDIAVCAACRNETWDPSNRRFRYPFTNCTNCGPRFSIIEALPYDRVNTSMRAFEMCSACQQEYADPGNRRFHAQPNACPDCGPQLALWDQEGKQLALGDTALRLGADTLRQGGILALKGLGGFQLIVDARNEDAVRRLRKRKRREEKPFALLCPSLEAVAELCNVSRLEARLLKSPESPIVLLERRNGGRSEGTARTLCASVAPNNPYLGIMLPYTPLHDLLMGDLGFAVVATSGNLTDEPICIDELEALDRLGDVADRFLVHDRPIVRHVDDSIVRVIRGRETILRRARGYAPLPVRYERELPTTLAVGGHLKNTIAVSVGKNVFLSQHIGDLETPEAFSAFQRVVADFEQLYSAAPERVVSDMHPDYLSTRWAGHAEALRVQVQHHEAHVAACMADNELRPPVLGVAWDGTGYGRDGTVWGGEFLLVRDRRFERVAALRRFRLPGGEAAIRQPWRTALGVLFEVFGASLFEMSDLLPVDRIAPEQRTVMSQMLEKGFHAPLTSSAGRLFDAVASIAGLRHESHFEGQAAMELEFTAERDVADAYPLEIRPGAECVVDWEPMIIEILRDVERAVATETIAAKFHNGLAATIVEVAERVGVEKVALTGGCFQNRRLTEKTVQGLSDRGFRPYWHQRVPPNDGGISLGQIVAAAMQVELDRSDQPDESSKGARSCV